MPESADVAAWSTEGFLHRLDEALALIESDERLRATEGLCAELLDHLDASGGCETEQAHAILDRLRRMRYFGLLERVSEAFIECGVETSRVHRQLAQALIERGEIRGALGVLQGLLASADNPSEQIEARGLVGRAHKQRWVAMRRTERGRRHLRAAIQAYYDAYREDTDRLWHGINAVAVLAAARPEGIETAGLPALEAIAEDILAVIARREKAAPLEDVWDLATAAEACLALGRTNEALGWAMRFATAPQEKVGAFELGSFLRQLTEVWQLREDEAPGSLLLPYLRSQLLAREGGRVTLPVDEAKSSIQRGPDRNLQQLLGTASGRTYRWYITGVGRCRPIGKVARRSDGWAKGTGFIVRGGDFHPSLGEERLLLTNAHVISDAPEVVARHNPLPPDEAEVTFELLARRKGATTRHAVAAVLWTSPPEDLDATLVRLDPAPPSVKVYPIAPPPLPEPDGARRIFVIGHPAGRSLEISFEDNLLLDCEDPKLHYRTPTEGGSSGSPTFDDQWRLVALHHAGGKEMPRLNGKKGTYPANEGIWIESILRRLAVEGVRAG